MTTVHDVAAFILRELGEMTTMKLQKLVYYSQAWSIVWDEKPLFRERIEAWANGPVVPELWKEHRQEYSVSTWPRGDADRLAAEQKETVEAVLRYYGPKSSQWLSDLTHMEEPWRDARKGLGPGERGNAEISVGSLLAYYGSLGPETARA